MEFTNDIKFSKQPTSNEILTINYSGKLFKENSSEVYIVYGFGENWDKTTEQKMEKNDKGFSVDIKIDNYNTFNFCFRNSQNIWDNNNYFNYISGITSEVTNSNVEQLSDIEATDVCSKVIDNMLDCIELNLEENPAEEKQVSINDDSSVLDSLIQELFEEYKNSKVQESNSDLQTKNTNENQSTTFETENDRAFTEFFEDSISEEQPSLSNEITEEEFDRLFDDLNEINKTSDIEFFKELSNLFDEIIQDIDSKQKTIQNIDVGSELNNIFENTFTNDFKPQENSAETFIPENVNEDVFSTDNTKTNDLNKTFSDIVKNISEVETKTNSHVDDLNYDYSDFNEMFAFAQNLNEDKKEDSIFDFSNLDFDFGMNNTSQISELEQETIKDSYTSNNFSDSFYDDEDIATHDSYSNFQEIVNNVVEELDQEATKEKLFETEEFEKQNAEFEKSISEYAEYFDNLIEEIISTPTASLSTPVSTEQVLENEKNSLAVIENQSVAIAESATTETEISTDAVPDEYALYDYKSHSIMYIIKRRFKLLVSTLFTKLPKIFGKDKNTENN